MPANVSSANAYLGTPDTLLSLLIVLIGLIGGGITLFLLARFSRLPAGTAITVFVWYLLIGSIHYLGNIDVMNSPDAKAYDAQAVWVAGSLGLDVPAGFSMPLYEGKEGFPIILGAIYRLFGRLPVGGVVLNSFVSALSILVIFATTRRAFGSNSFRFSQGFVLASFLLSPAYFTHGWELLREALCWFGVALTLYSLVVVVKAESRMVGLCSGVVGVGTLLWVRDTLGILSLAAFIGAIFASLIWRQLGGAGLAALVITMTVGIAAFSDRTLEVFGYDGSRLSLIRNANMNDARSGYEPLLGFLSNYGVGGEILATVPNAIFGPFLWEIEPELVWAWVLVSAIFWWWAMVVVAARVWNGGLNPVTVSIITFAAVLLIGMSITLTNYGLLFRIRTIPMIILLVFMAEVRTQRHSPAQKHVIPSGVHCRARSPVLVQRGGEIS